MIIDPRLKEVIITPNGYFGRYKHLHMMCTECTEDDGKKWRHASVSFYHNKKDIPTYQDMLLLKEICIGNHHTAIQVFPKEEQYFHGRAGTQVLHLWACMDGDILPDFRKEAPSGQMEI